MNVIEILHQLRGSEGADLCGRASLKPVSGPVPDCRPFKDHREATIGLARN
jgi:hypothetical protein